MAAAVEKGGKKGREERAGRGAEGRVSWGGERGVRRGCGGGMQPHKHGRMQAPGGGGGGASPHAVQSAATKAGSRRGRREHSTALTVAGVEPQQQAGAGGQGEERVVEADGAVGEGLEDAVGGEAQAAAVAAAHVGDFLARGGGVSR